MIPEPLHRLEQSEAVSAAFRAIFHPRRFPDRGHPPTGRFACVRTTISDS
jgi:hypothetical protein